MDIPLSDAKMVYFSLPQITWSNPENTHPPIWLPIFIQRDLLGGAVGGGILIRRSSVEIISSFVLLGAFFLYETTYTAWTDVSEMILLHGVGQKQLNQLLGMHETYKVT